MQALRICKSRLGNCFKLEECDHRQTFCIFSKKAENKSKQFCTMVKNKMEDTWNTLDKEKTPKQRSF